MGRDMTGLNGGNGARREVFVGPTIERLRRADPHLIEPPVVDQKVTRRAWRVGTIIDGMIASGALNEACRQSVESFERDVARAALEAPLVANYGERAIRGGTPLHQMLDGAMRAAEAREEMQSNALARVVGATRTIAEPRQRNALMMAVTGNHSLAEIGKACGVLAGDRQREIEAKVMLRSAVWQVHTYYQTIYGQANAAP